MSSSERTNDTTATTAPQEDAPGLAEVADQSPAFGSSPPSDRRMSAEWDASKVPPSRFQKRKGSIYAVPGSRDGRVDSNYAHKYHEKLAEKGWSKSDKKT